MKPAQVPCETPLENLCRANVDSSIKLLSNSMELKDLSLEDTDPKHLYCRAKPTTPEAIQHELHLTALACEGQKLLGTSSTYLNLESAKIPYPSSDKKLQLFSIVSLYIVSFWVRCFGVLKLMRPWQNYTLYLCDTVIRTTDIVTTQPQCFCFNRLPLVVGTLFRASSHGVNQEYSGTYEKWEDIAYLFRAQKTLADFYAH